ncbi:Xaa-Pro aminopeptidase 1 [Frankliniella fusca]|uniref:Xaa-Pro aminopeptidase 1 n=1 Tax=Frankliniella fusca TaxID=407009 RepID=A0AAE1LNS0_9NEOP|nr:Xaa-Pro aminopeptidase 1 [Frankliniella fusca]
MSRVVAAAGLAEPAGYLPGLPYPRLSCDGDAQVQPEERVITADRVAAVRRRLKDHGLHALIVPYSDEHQNEWVGPHNERLRWLSGSSGAGASVAVVTRSTASHVREYAVLWTDARFLQLADEQLDCSWQLRQLRSPLQVADWLVDHLSAGDKVGADPRVVLQQQWEQWYNRMYNENSVELVEVMPGVVDEVWTQGRPDRPRLEATVHRIGQRGQIWQNRVKAVQKQLQQRRVDGLVLTALDEIAWLLNIRGRDLPYAPLLTAYLVVGLQETVLYVDGGPQRITPAIEAHLKAANCVRNRICVSIRPYEQFWTDLAQPTNRTTMWISNHPRLGASRAVQQAVRRRHDVHQEWSPVIALKSVKNEVEREAMHSAHALDGAAMCELLSFLDAQVAEDGSWTETRVAERVDFFRQHELSFRMTAFPTHVGYGQHGALPHYVPRASSDLLIGKESTVVIDSGGQYENGTTDVARTLHFGAPARVHVEAYTRVLQGLIELSRASVPASMGAHSMDSLARAAVWEGGENYGHPTGHGIGAALNVHEEPNIFYGENAQRLQVGNFLTAEPGYYKKNDFGVRLENVLEVVEKKSLDSPDAPLFYEFRTATLVPFSSKLIDVSMLSPQQRNWLNEYNARVREEVGEVLKAKLHMSAFYWMLNQTLYVPEHCCPRTAGSGAPAAPLEALLLVLLGAPALAAALRPRTVLNMYYASGYLCYDFSVSTS